MAEEIILPEVLWRTRLTTGKAHSALKRPDQAHKAFDLAIASIEKLRSQVVGSEQEHQRFFEDKLAPYHQMIQLLIEQKSPTEAFAYAERAKARALLDTLQTGRVNITKAMTPEKQELERRLNSETVSINAQISQEKMRDQPDGSHLARLNSRLEKARLDYEAFSLSLYAAHPELKIQRGQMQPISVDDSRELIQDSNTALLEYVVTEDKTYIFVLTRQQQPTGSAAPSSAGAVLNVYTLNIKQKDVSDRVELLRKMIATTDIRFRKPARELFELLIKPAADQLRGKSQLIIVPEAEKLVLTLGQLYGAGQSKIYTGAEASEERFKTEALGYRILHLATHGILNDRHPMYSHLLLSQPEVKTKTGCWKHGNW